MGNETMLYAYKKWTAQATIVIHYVSINIYSAISSEINEDVNNVTLSKFSNRG